MKFIRLMIIGLGMAGLAWIVLTLTGVAPVMQAQNPTWSTSVRVSPESGIAWFPEIMADLEGHIHLFWATGRSTSQDQSYDLVTHCLIKDDKCLNPADIIALTGGGSIVPRSAATIDSQNKIHLLSRRTAIYYTQAPADQANLPEAWSPLRTISGRNDAAYSDIAIDHKGNIHIVWSEQIPPTKGEEEGCFYCSDIFYRRSNDDGKTWSAPIDLTNSEMGSEKPQLVINDQDELFLFWEEGADFYSPSKAGEPVSSGMVYSGDGGNSWSSPVTFIFPGDAPQQITAGFDQLGQLVVVWRLVKSLEIYYQISLDQGKSWSIPKIIPGVLARRIDNDLDAYSMAPDSANHLHLILVGTSPNADMKTSSVFHLEWNGATWSTPEAIFTVTNGDLPEYPRIVVVNGNQLHVTWFTRDEAHIYAIEKGGKYQIWYAHGESQAPVQIPVILPMPTSTPIPTVSPTAIPTPTPTLDPDITRSSVPAGAIDSIYTDTDDIILLGESLLPALLILVVVVVFVRFWRGN